MSDVDGVLTAIDQAVADWEVSDDAVRFNGPDPVEDPDPADNCRPLTITARVIPRFTIAVHDRVAADFVTAEWPQILRGEVLSVVDPDVPDGHARLVGMSTLIDPEGLVLPSGESARRPRRHP